MTDNQDILNEAEVDFLLSGAEEDANVEGTSLDDGNQTVTMHGDLDQIRLADIFQTLALSKMEGVLRVRNPLEERQIFCSEGYVRILVPTRLTLRRLGQRLIQAGLLQPEQLRSALVEQRKEKIPLGQLLIRDELITQDALDDIVGMQVAEDLFSLFTWRHGTFEFFKGDPANKVLRSQFEQCPEYEVNSLLLEVARRSDEWESILDAVGSLDEVPRQIAQPAKPEELEDSHIAVLEGIDARSTYRQLADHTTIGLFAFCRAARDLASGAILGTVDDPGLIAIASELAEEGEQKRAIVLLQTLRDRAGDRSLDVIKGMADVLQVVGERRFASSLLLEAAQRSGIAEDAIDLARTARDLVPYDPGTLSFLRTVLVAHSQPDSAELEKCTVDLLDALIDGDLIPTALEIIDDARRTNTMRPQILMREARARQKAKDVEGAVTTLLELAQHYKSEGNSEKTVAAYEAIQRLDRSRKDVQRLLNGLKRTRIGQLIRVGAALAVVAMIGGMGFVWWQQNAFEKAIATATSEVQVLLDQGDRAKARQTLSSWREQLGDCESIQDLASRVTFAESAEKNRLAKLQRARINEEFTKAATALGRGELSVALMIYQEVHSERGMQKEVLEVVENRMGTLVDEFVRASNLLRSNMPPDPNQLFDRSEVTAHLSTLQQACSPALVRCFDELSELSEQSQLPEFLASKTKMRIAESLESSRPDIEACRRLSQAYAEALERNDTQRRLDPMFKAAVEKEARFDFGGALKLYSELESQPTGDAELRTHFRDRVTRNATITRLLEALEAATKAGDFGTAQQQLRALRVSFPEVPFDGLVRLPLKITSEPSKAKVIVNGTEVGMTPLLLSRVPSDKTNISIISEGFGPMATEAVGDGEAEWTAQLTLLPKATWQHNSAIESRPVFTGDQQRIFVDRGGKVHKVTSALDTTTWSFASDDLSGWLTTPLQDGGQALVGSLDGKLRAINLTDGNLAWSLDELPTEVHPVLIGRTLVMATSDRRLHTIDLAERRRKSVDMGQTAYGSLLATGQNVIAIGEGGLVTCFSIPDMKTVWQRDTERLQSPHALHDTKVVVVGDDQGQLIALDLLTGEIKWQRNLEKALLGNLALANGTVVVVAPDHIHRIHAHTGKDLEGFAPRKQGWSGEATIIGNRMIVPVQTGSLQVLDAATGKHLYRLQGNAKSRVFATDGQVFISSSDHKVRSYGVLR
ncbi:MAG: outer membrane protein assembly factor BamB/tetratricopeptide (TPR) repeat protein [Planctomycetota bacterium]|jgi:outer membrane protein assembly factor BamB/tetratricopeptide (TPR) repeat protein